MAKVLITDNSPLEHFAALVGLAEMTTGPADGSSMARADVLAVVSDYDAIINNTDLQVNAELLDAAAKLSIVANMAIGADNLDTELMAQRNVWATNVPDAFTEASADATMMLLLAAARRLVFAENYARSGRWAEVGIRCCMWEDVLLAGKTLGIIGYGKIGQAVAHRARAFGMNICFHRRTASEDPEYRRLDDLLAESDFVSLHVPLTADSDRLINADTLARMKRGAFLINMSRGRVVDQDAVIAALKSGQLRGAGLDVFENEPHIHPELVKMDNVVLTPHLGGGTYESRQRAREVCGANVAAVLQGQRPLTPLNEPVTAAGGAIDDR